MTIKHPFLSLLVLAALSGCSPAPTDSGGTAAPGVSNAARHAPPGAAPGTCWGKHITPAIIETVTHQALVQPAHVLADGTVTQPAVFKTETRQEIVRPREETWFETPCADVLTHEFVASLQRALTARGLYRGTPTGNIDIATRAAIRRYQEPRGLDSGTLSLDTARALGLVAVVQPEQG